MRAGLSAPVSRALLLLPRHVSVSVRVLCVHTTGFLFARDTALQTMRANVEEALFFPHGGPGQQKATGEGRG